jgi:hypothetical protein
MPSFPEVLAFFSINTLDDDDDDDVYLNKLQTKGV